MDVLKQAGDWNNDQSNSQIMVLQAHLDTSEKNQVKLLKKLAGLMGQVQQG